MAVIYPAGTGVQGNLGVKWVEAIADEAAPSLATELEAASSVDISCYLYAGGWNVTVNANKGAAPRRLCTRQTTEQFGATTYTLADLLYTLDPQAADSDPDNAALAALTAGSEGFIVVRMGLDARELAWAVGQYVNVYAVRLGEQNHIGDTTDEFAEFQVQQPAILTKPPVLRSVIAA